MVLPSEVPGVPCRIALAYLEQDPPKLAGRFQWTALHAKDLLHASLPLLRMFIDLAPEVHPETWQAQQRHFDCSSHLKLSGSLLCHMSYFGILQANCLL